MRIDRQPRARLPGRLAIVFNTLALVVVMGVLAIGETTIRSASSSMMQLAGLQKSRDTGVSVDSSGQIRYRSRTVTLDDLAAAIKRDIGAGGTRDLVVRVNVQTDAAKVAQVLRAAGLGGAGTVHLSMTQ